MAGIILAAPLARTAVPCNPHATSQRSRARSRPGAANSASRRSASPASTWPRTSSGCGLAGARASRHDAVHGAARHAPHAPGRTGPRHAARRQRAHGLPARRPRTPTAVLNDPCSATCRATRSAATTTRCCATGSRGWPSASPPRPAPRAIAPSRTARPCWRRRSPAMPASAGSASTRTCSTGTTARGSSSARSTPTCRCPSTRR